jgi:hypothetical protein
VEDVYSGLRQQILDIDPRESHLQPIKPGEETLGVLMEMARPGAVVTLVGLADNTTSLYFSNGGGIIGNGPHEPVAQATFAWISLANQLLGALAPRQSFPLPADGTVAFHVLTTHGWYGADANEQDLVELVKSHHPLGALWAAGQDVITQIRLVQEAQSPPN